MNVKLQKKVIPLMIMIFTFQSMTTHAAQNYVQHFTQSNVQTIDPYYQITKKTVTELSDEEALEFVNDEENKMTFSLGEKNGPRLPKIPPRPPEVNPGIKEDEDLNDTGIVSDDDTESASKDDPKKDPKQDPKEPVKKDPPKKDPPKKDPPKRDDSDISIGSDLVASNGKTPGGGVGGALDSIIMVVDKISAIGQKITPIIEKGRPVVTNNPMAALSVIPRLDTKDPVLHEMGGWSIPMTKHYKIAFSNGFGSEVVSFVYSITYQFGGNYKGSGKYLTGVRASARNLVVSWGFDLDASSTLVQISNIGTTANPVAGATVEISYTVKNWSRINTTNEAFFIAGDGRLFKMD
jgi:hypothetical protein